MKTRRRLREHTRWCPDGRMPGQRLKRKKWLVVFIVLSCATLDVLLLFISEKAVSILLEDAPYLPMERAQSYTHLAAFRTDSASKHQDAIDAIAFSPDGLTLAAGGYRAIHLWDVRTGNPIDTLKDGGGWVHALSFSPDGKTLASVSTESRRDGLRPVILLDPLVPLEDNGLQTLVSHTIRLRDTRSGATRLTFPVDTLPITTLEFSSDGTQLLITSQQGFIDIYDSDTGYHERLSGSLLVYNVMCRTYQFNALAFSLDGTIFATGSRNMEQQLYDVAGAEIGLWDADTGHLLHTFNQPGGRIKLLTFSPDRKTLASVGYDGVWWNRKKKIFVWDVENRRLLSMIDVGMSGVRALQFAPDSITLGSAHGDGTVHLWDITGRTNR